MTTALEGLRVLDLTEPEGHLCGRLLADLGAEVIKVEPPRGDAARHTGPFKGDFPDPEASLPFCYLNTNKKSVVIDPSTTEGRAKFKALSLTSDAIIETFPPGTMQGWNLDYPSLQKDNKKIKFFFILLFFLSLCAWTITAKTTTIATTTNHTLSLTLTPHPPSSLLPKRQQKK